MRKLLVILLASFALQGWAEEASLIDNMALAKAPINRSDMESIKNGAKFFATNCMSCHTLTYLRYDKLAQEAGITYDKMPFNLKMDPIPPDLSLEASIRGVDWIYTYLHTFYVDKNRPSGANNLLVHNTGMPNILAPMYGEQVLVEKPQGDYMGTYQWYDLLKQTHQGSLTPAEFDAKVTDLVNFLAYASEPYQQEQHRLGWWVLGFITFLGIMMYFLKKEYWKDVKKRRDN